MKIVAGALPLVMLTGCPPAQNGQLSDRADAAERTYVAPGDHDDYYLFYSGGHSGQVFVAGMPSMRHIVTVPVFTPDPGVGWGYDDDSREMLGGMSWGDVHHPALSQTDGRYDGRWLFVNDNANNRVARIDLRDFVAKQILGPIPNTSGNHGSSFITQNSEYLFGGTRFSVPLPEGRYASPTEYADEYNGVLTAISIDPDSGHMEVAWQVLTPPFNWDLSSAGKGPSHGWVFYSSYNTEMAHTVLESNASQLDRDLGAALNWKAAEEAIAAGNYTEIGGVRVIDPTKAPGVLYFFPVAKSPHGMDVTPDGKWFIAGGKLSPTAGVYNFEKFLTAIENEDFEDEKLGIPVVNFDSILEGEVPVGLGPLHNQFDNKGNAYTSLFIDSQITKWRLPPWTEEERANLEQVIVDKIDVHYNIGHLMVPGSDTREPYGEWLVAMNKHGAGRPLPVGPNIPETSQLIDITGEKMVMVAEAFTDKEPHFAQAIPASELSPTEVYPRAENQHPHAVWSFDDTGVTRDGNKVEVKMISIRSRFVPDVIEVNAGDEVTFHITNIEQSPGQVHGFGVGLLDINGSINPGETKSYTIKVDETGVFPFYCTVFCSALHQEMQGYLAVKPNDGSDDT
ncbi:MAG TPA: Sec-dependent nitrous-oxide reductase [Opitutales bacterium]|nr:Sec-dependent nitrous-oxide reductase [Opitutales bacterium]